MKKIIIVRLHYQSMINSLINNLQWEDVQTLWTLISTIGGWLFSIGLLKYAVTELTAPRIEVSNIHHVFSPFPRKAEDMLTIQYTIKNTSYLGRFNPLPRPIQNYTFGYWFMQGSTPYKIEKNLSRDEFFIPYGRSIDALQPIKMFFTSNTEYTMILQYQMGDRVLCYKSFPVHINEVPEKEDWVLNQKDS